MTDRLKAFDPIYSEDAEYYGWVPSPHLLACEGVLRSAASGSPSLDVGSGEGRDARWLALIGLHMTCLDVSAEGLRAAQAVGLAVCRGSAVQLPFKTGSMSLVNATTVVDHLDRDDAQCALSELRRVVAPGGLIALEVFTTSDPACAGGDEVSETAAMVKRYFEPGELRHLLSDLEVIYYSEGIEPDWSHGAPHSHGVARLVGRSGQ